MTRRHDWPARLSELVTRAHALPFSWGTHDCCLWAADAVVALTGRDPAQDLRGRYFDAIDAYRALRQIGGLLGAGQRTGTRLAGPGFALDGDVALVHDGRRPMLAVRSADVWLCAASRGLFALPQSAARITWGVGHA
jgi:hypothetical protein